MSDDYQFEEEEFSTEFNGHTLWRILATNFPHWPLFLAFMFSITLVSISESYMTFLEKRIIDEGILASDVNALISLAIQFGLVLLMQSVLVFVFIMASGTLGEKVQYDLRRTLFDKLQNLSFSYFDKTPIGWIISRVTSDTERIAELVTWGILDVTWALANITTGLTFMFIINWRLTLIVAGVLPVIVVVAAWFKKFILVEYRKVRMLNSKITGAYNENITGVRVVKAMRREERNLEEFGELSDSMYKAGFRAAWLSAAFLPIVQILSAFAVGGIVWYGGFQIQVGGLTLGGLHAFIGYITFMLWPVSDLARVYAESQRAIASAERIFSLADAVPVIVDAPDARAPESVFGDIEFENVDFWYEADKPVLQAFNLHIKAGEAIALVGHTGSGKSTIVNLLCRFYEPTNGRILINGEDYTRLTQHSIHSRIGMVLQTPHLFSGSIRENLRYGRLDATDEELEEAAKLAGAHEFIVTLEKGYDEPVGEGGNLLSVGQKQLISLARAILAQPDIFIMDEATSSVDTLTEALIQQGMDALIKRSTSFIIAHRLSTIKRADRILVINEGKIIEQGSHSSLIRARGHYYELYTKQFRDKLEASYGLSDLLGATNGNGRGGNPAPVPGD